MQDITSFVQQICRHTAALFVRNSIRNASETKLTGRNLQRCAGAKEKIYDLSPSFLETAANYQTRSEEEQTFSHRSVGNAVSIRSTETLGFALRFLCKGSCSRKLAGDHQICTIISQCSVCRHRFPYLQLDHEYLLTYSMQYSPSETDRFSASQEITRILWNESSLPHSQQPATCTYPQQTMNSQQ